MATIIMGTYMVRYPLGGNLSWALQYLLGLKDLGHDVYAVEKYVHPDSCYDPVNQKMSNDCSYGVKVVDEIMARYGLADHWCFVGFGEIYYGMSKEKINATFRRADLYIENGAHGVWDEEAQSSSAVTAYIDVDPAFTQFKFYRKITAGLPLPQYDMYFTNGMNVGKEGNIIPACNIQWHYIFNPVRTTLFETHPPATGAAYSTIMNWVSYKENVEYQGVSYGHKSMEFDKFLNLPGLVDVKMELAMAGLDSKKEKETIRDHGWEIKNAQEVTFSIDSFRKYLVDCRGEFSVVKNMYQATQSGWFSDKSAAFMASGRPVVLQETGFSDYLPVGEGLFAVNDVDEAKAAIESIESDYEFHSKRALEIANEYLEAKKVLKQFLNELGIN